MSHGRPGGGWPAIRYVFQSARRVGGLWKLYRALRSRNACKTCALGMGGQRGGMVNELGRFPEVCKKSIQAMAADMQGRIRPEFFERFGFDALRAMSPRELEHMGRLNEPVYAGPDDTHYRPISWDEALRRCAGWLKSARPDESFFYFSGRSSNEAAFLWQLFARVYGTNNVNNCSYYCHQASGVGLREVLGTGTATVILRDVEHCDLFFLIGGNPASNHPRLMTLLADIRKRGGNVVVVNPIREPGLVEFRIPSRPLSLLWGTSIASHYVQPHIGGDVALLTGIAKRIVELSAVDDAFVREHTEHADSYLEWLRGLEWDALERGAGVPRAQIDEIARLYAASRAAIFGWTMGITHHVHGTENVRAIVNLALLRGMLGRPHAGLLPIRGHSNVQGVGSVGVVPKLNSYTLGKLEALLGLSLPRTPGLDTLAGVEAMRAGHLRHAFCLGGNLFGASPDAAETSRAFKRLESVTYLSTTLNTGHAWGRARETLILPVRTRDEEAQSTTQESMFNFVRISDGGAPRMPGPRGEVEIVVELAERVLGQGGSIDWRRLADHDEIRTLIAATVPGYEAIERVGRTKREFYVRERTFHQPHFRTPNGKARFSVLELPPADDVNGKSGDQLQVGPPGMDSRTGLAASIFQPGPAALRLMTIRSEGQFNTVVYEEEDLYRGQTRRDVILMNPEDIARLGLREDQRVTVRSAAGVMSNILVREFDIRAGNAAMYYPEANALVPSRADPRSRTPAFKNVRVWLEVASGRAGVPLTVAGDRRANRDLLASAADYPSPSTSHG